MVYRIHQDIYFSTETPPGPPCQGEFVTHQVQRRIRSLRRLPLKLSRNFKEDFISFAVEICIYNS